MIVMWLFSFCHHQQLPFSFYQTFVLIQRLEKSTKCLALFTSPLFNKTRATGTRNHFPLFGGPKPLFWAHNPCLGTCFSCLVVGPKPLDPSNINWLAGWDPSQEYFGWASFRNGPWLFPIGLNPNYGMEFSSSIVYSDSLPILALLFKLLSPILPNTFQYLGLWNLTCFILQAIFAWKLISLFTNERWLLFFATGLFIFAPPFLWKVNSSNSLISQFLIIWALYLIFKPKTSKNFYWWLLLLIFAEAIHFYIFVMVFVLWISNLLDELFFPFGCL